MEVIRNMAHGSWSYWLNLKTMVKESEETTVCSSQKRFLPLLSSWSLSYLTVTHVSHLERPTSFSLSWRAHTTSYLCKHSRLLYLNFSLSLFQEIRRLSWARLFWWVGPCFKAHWQDPYTNSHDQLGGYMVAYSLGHCLSGVRRLQAYCVLPSPGDSQYMAVKKVESDAKYQDSQAKFSTLPHESHTKVLFKNCPTKWKHRNPRHVMRVASRPESGGQSGLYVAEE